MVCSIMANWQVVIEGRFRGEDCLNVLYYQSSGVEPPDFQDMADQMRALINGNIVEFAGGEMVWVGLTYRQDIPGSVGVFVPFSLGTLNGTNATASQMAQASVLVRKRSNAQVRPVVGWAFQGGIVVDGLSALGSWESNIQAAVLNLWEAMQVYTLDGPTTMTMVLKASNPTAPNTQPYTVVDTITVAGNPSALDGRRLGIGS
jgi:hypothetical protein